jgi:peptidoglycan/LPS O-acetylase OafA/YrhL
LNHYHGLPALLRTLAEFCLGVLLYRAHSGGEAGTPRKWVSVTAILFLGLAIVTRFDFLLVGAFACLIYYAVNATNVIARLLNSHLLVALGNWSYSIYLLHVPTHYAVMAAFVASGNSVNNLSLWHARLLLLAMALVVVGLSAVSYRYFETPVRHLIVRACVRDMSASRSGYEVKESVLSCGPTQLTSLENADGKTDVAMDLTRSDVTAKAHGAGR